MTEPDRGRPPAALQSVGSEPSGFSTLTVLHTAHRGGATISTLRLLPWIQERGPVEIVVPAGSRRTIELPEVPVTSMRYRPLVLPRGPRSVVEIALRLVRETLDFRRLLREKKPSLLLVSTSALIPPLVAARLEGIPTVTRVAELYRGRSATGRRRGLAAKLLLRLTESLSGAVICCSHAVAQQFSQYGEPAVGVAYPQIDPNPAPGDGGAFRAANGLDPEAPIVASAGDISAGRGQDLLIRALPAIREQIPEAICVIAGEPLEREADRAYADELPRMAEQLGVGGAVKFVGVVPKIADLYAAAAVVANPARFPEPFGRVGPEALVAGRPVVSTRVGGVPEVLEHDRDALLVAPEDPGALAEATLRLALDGELRERLVDHGQERVRRRFGDAQAAAALSQAIEAAIVASDAAAGR